MKYLTKNTTRLRAIILSGIWGNITISEAAKIMNVTRPTLSNLLNGKAELSMEMAFKIEQWFRYDGYSLMEMQLKDKWEESFQNLRTMTFEEKANG